MRVKLLHSITGYGGPDLPAGTVTSELSEELCRNLLRQKAAEIVPEEPSFAPAPRASSRRAATKEEE